MGRIITGGLMIGWSFIIIPANLAPDGTVLDLWFGLVLLISGAVLARSGWQRAQATARTETGSADRATESPLVSVASGLVTGLLQKFLGI